MHRDSRRINRIGTTNVFTVSRHTIFPSSFVRSSLGALSAITISTVCFYTGARLANPVTSSSQNGRARKYLPWSCVFVTVGGEK